MQWILKTLEYAAAVGDQTVVTGDMIDFISHGNLTLMNRVIAEPYSDALMLVGNHEPVRLVSETSKLSDPNKWSDEYYAILKKYWANHELSYTSKMVGKEVMVIQMDNSHYYFTQEQIDQLTDDLNRARRNGYTVLVFTHIPFVPTDGIDTQELLMGTGGFVESDRAASVEGSDRRTNLTLIDGIDADWTGTNEKTGKQDSLTPTEHVATTEAMYQLIVDSSDVIRGVFNGHKHNTIYSRLYTEGGAVIPQYTLAAGFLDGGVTLKINVEDTDPSDNTVANRVLHKDAQNLIYVDDATGITVRETTLDLDLGEGNEKTIVQISDAHLNNTEKRNQNWEECLKYADEVGDYTVATGDLIDAMTPTILQYFKDSTESYTDLMTVVGNHDWVKADESIPEDMTDRYAKLEDYWKNDPYYSKAMLGEKVMLIQMDNSQESGKFWDSQIEQLQSDIQSARDNGYYVLLFMHVPLGTMNDPAEISVKPLYYTEADEEEWPTYNFAYKQPCSTSTDATNKAICDFIRESGDVIKGVFAGHLHADFYTEIKCKASAGGQLIPQYVSHRAAADNGHVLKITLK